MFVTTNLIFRIHQEVRRPFPWKSKKITFSRPESSQWPPEVHLTITDDICLHRKRARPGNWLWRLDNSAGTNGCTTRRRPPQSADTIPATIRGVVGAPSTSREEEEPVEKRARMEEMEQENQAAPHVADPNFDWGNIWVSYPPPLQIGQIPFVVSIKFFVYCNPNILPIFFYHMCFALPHLLSRAIPSLSSSARSDATPSPSTSPYPFFKNPQLTEVVIQ